GCLVPQAMHRSITLKLTPMTARRDLWFDGFPPHYRAMECAQHIVTLGPSAVELVDRTMIELARGNPAFRATIDAALVGEPDAILLVEFIGETRDELIAKLAQLTELMADLGLPNNVMRMVDASPQKALCDVRKAGLNIMMSMR